jgi:starch phosphorylase
MEKMNTVQPLFPHLPERLAGLDELAENLWWSWNPGAPDYRAMPCQR